MEEVRPTRSELLERRTQMNLAGQGVDLLKRKRDALLVEFMGIVDDTVRLSDTLEERTAEAQYALTIARAVDGPVMVHSAALATREGVLVDVHGSKVMGVPIAEVDKIKAPIRTPLTRGYSVVGVSSRIDETAERFELVLDTLIEYAGVESRMRRLGEEIQRTSRRVNALEQITIPRLAEQVSYIRMTLDERAREDLFRLKKVKRKIAAAKSERRERELVQRGS
jgi:V/A-type H+-transporting ATPase subunit D